MKKVFGILIFGGTCIACNNDSYQKAEDAQDAGREFIRASLDGDYKKARFYLYNDSSDSNLMLLNKWRSNYNHLNEEEKISYKQASIRAIKIEPLNDSIVNYTYTNSYKPTDTTTIKIVRINSEWLVDFKDIH
jgi:hypothetical protein